MPAEVSPKKLQLSVQKGFDRFRNFRNARLMFLRNYVGQYYDKDHGEVGTEALNLIFNAIRILVPNIVMSFPKHRISSRYLSHKQYAEMLEMALGYHDKEIDIKDTYRRCIVDAIFTLGILKTGLAESDSVYAFDDYDQIDTGSIYTESVDFDNFVADPNSKDHLFRDAAYIGDRICVPRSALLDSGLYKNELVERLPAVGTEHTADRARDLSRRNINPGDDDSWLQEYVEVVELWVPQADALVTVPGAKDVIFDDYLRVDDYYGPDTGPYTFLALTPPVPGNPLPVPAVGIWNDLHTLSNRMAKKIIEQAERQKDVVGYKRSAADDAQEALDASDGEAIAMDDPDGLKVYSFGGQKQSNEVHLAQLQSWFNMMSANPEALSGQRFDADSATEARILANNANVHLADMKDLVYTMAAEEAKKRAWFLHTDPFINLPLVKRETVPAQYQMTPQGPVTVQPAQQVDAQIFLTPEARSGDFLDFTFEVWPESMGRKDSQSQFMEAMDFAVKILPAAMTAAQTAMMLGFPFSAKAFLIRMAKDRGIDWIEEVFYDPEFQLQMAMYQLRSPQSDESKGKAVGAAQSPNALTQFMQNGQPGSVMGSAPSPIQQERQQQQAGANEGQRLLQEFGV